MFIGVFQAKETSPSDAEEREKARENEQRVMETRIAWENREKVNVSEMILCVDCGECNGVCL